MSSGTQGRPQKHGQPGGIPIVATEQGPEQVEATSPACAVPDGTAHALDPGSRHTHCGLDASRLMPWPELTWPPSGMAAVDTCPTCGTVAPVGSDHG